MKRYPIGIVSGILGFYILSSGFLPSMKTAAFSENSVAEFTVNSEWREAIGGEIASRFRQLLDHAPLDVNTAYGGLYFDEESRLHICVSE